MSSVDALVGRIVDVIVFPLMGLLVVTAFLVFIWGLFEFLTNMESEEEKKKGKQHMVWGIAGLVIIFSAVAILRIAANTFELRNNPTVNRLLQ